VVLKVEYIGMDWRRATRDGRLFCHHESENESENSKNFGTLVLYGLFCAWSKSVLFKLDKAFTTRS